MVLLASQDNRAGLLHVEGVGGVLDTPLDDRLDLSIGDGGLSGEAVVCAPILIVRDYSVFFGRMSKLTSTAAKKFSVETDMLRISSSCGCLIGINERMVRRVREVDALNLHSFYTCYPSRRFCQPDVSKDFSRRAIAVSIAKPPPKD